MRTQILTQEQIHQAREAYVLHVTKHIGYEDLAKRYGLTKAALTSRIRSYCQDLRSEFRNIAHREGRKIAYGRCKSRNVTNKPKMEMIKIENINGKNYLVAKDYCQEITKENVEQLYKQINEARTKLLTEGMMHIPEKSKDLEDYDNDFE